MIYNLYACASDCVLEYIIVKHKYDQVGLIQSVNQKLFMEYS